MTTLQVPPIDYAIPSLGSHVAEWMEASLAHGPGDLRGQPYRLDEKRALLWRLYEVYPKGRAQAGPRSRYLFAALDLTAAEQERADILKLAATLRDLATVATVGLAESDGALVRGLLGPMPEAVA